MSNRAVHFCSMDKHKVKTMSVVHVDNVFVVGSGNDSTRLRLKMPQSFPTNYLGKLKWHMGCVFERDREAGKLKLSQTSFIDKLSQRFEVVTASSIPACSSVELRKLEKDEDEVEASYREAVGSLMRLANVTCPGIANAIRAVARFTNRPVVRNWKATTRVMQHLIGTRELEITFCKGLRQHLVT